ncbi:MAG TPA: GNAT family N-acetyltransferase [Atribacteraceae bacterium]|nr:GNAT family N-acetyltransferase [Atribacteraceae bacterium]
MCRDIFVRKVQPGDDAAVWRVAKTLSILERYYFYYLTYKPHRTDALVAVDKEKVIGCVIPKVATLGGEKVGIVGGIFVDRAVQRKGVGKILVDAALSRFREEGCQTYYVLVNRYNSGSWNMFLHYGFTPFEFNEQFKDFGWRMLQLWLVNGYLWEPGTFILRHTGTKNQIPREAAEGWHLLLAWFVFSFGILAMQIVFGDPSPEAIPLILGVAGTSILAHELSHKLAAGFFRLKTVFKVWESGLALGALLSFLGVGFFQYFYGSTFIQQRDWPYNKRISLMGLIYSVGPVISLALASCFLGLTHWANTEWLATVGIFGARINVNLALFNLLPIFPFDGFDGRKIFLWNKLVWSMLVVWLVLLLGVVRFS